MLGDESYQLAQEAKRLEAEHLLPYNSNQVALVVRQTNQLWKTVEKLAKMVEVAQEAFDSNTANTFSMDSSSLGDPESSQISFGLSEGSSSIAPSKIAKSQYSKNQETINSSQTTNKTIVKNLESEHLKSLMSQLVLHHLTFSANAMSLPESGFVREYTLVSKDYRDKVERSLSLELDLDWTADMLKPPKDLFIEVRVIKDCGQIQTETGIVNLKKGSQHYLRRTDVENLIKLGYLQHIS
ncbi:hypothetical protein BB560_000583 [Smittium megazygosporum]|uniref:DNA replication complex GINS protein PSF1 n=1 Tax=Smittium megazygosporum TaxID=133381 RepID=A0A2T9ZJU6_9FUNG|nr:hypothetical protein BB560_000583 [Smittium megazygosporum]